jgi:hypothetical protein
LRNCVPVEYRDQLAADSEPPVVLDHAEEAAKRRQDRARERLEAAGPKDGDRRA